MAARAFSGRITVDCVCQAATNFLVIHARFLQLHNSSILMSGTERATVSVSSFCPGLDQLYIQFQPACQAKQPLRLTVHFSGVLEKRLDGFYISDYKTRSAEVKNLLTTHMEPTFARQAFPCFDEPFFKANFSLEMIRDANHYSLFNMPLESTKTLGNNLFLDKYLPTVRMSTYLVAYMLLPRDYISVDGFDSRNRTQIRIFAPSDQKSYTTYALNVSKKVLPFFENLFGLDYPLPKLDMIAIPDFSAGAMENWGLITYKMFALLIRPSSTKIHHRTSIAKIISHEIAHQWFGNIVTMDWWNDLWLNEGFASYSEYLGGDYANKEWRLLEQFYLDQFVDAMNVDALVNSHPIQVPVKDPQEIESIFDQISYGKGASLVRMLEGILGMPTLKKGLSIYLNRYRYRNAVSDNLWEAFSEAYSQQSASESMATAGQENPLLQLKSVMSTWLNQMNFPLVTFHRQSPNSFSLTQQRFLLYSNSTKYWSSIYEAKHNYVWSIPLLYLTDKMQKPKLIWLNMEKAKDFSLDHDFSWIKLNYGQTGFFRVNYDEEQWESLIKALHTDMSRFSTVDRAGLLSDAFALARSGHLNISVALSLSRYLVNEVDLVPWYVATDVFVDIKKQLFYDIDINHLFEKFAVSLVRSVVENSKVSTWNSTSMTAYETLVQSAVMQFAVVFKHQPTIQTALKQYKIYKANGKITNANLHYLSLYSAVTNDQPDQGNALEEWEYLLKQMLETRDSDTRRALRKTLAKTQNTRLLNRLFYVTKKIFKHQEMVTVLFDAAHNNGAGLDQAWLFLQRNWKYFEKNVAQHYFLVSELFKICNGLTTEMDFDQANRFFTTKKLGFGERSANQSLEIIKSNIYWNQRNKADFKNWLIKNQSSN